MAEPLDEAIPITEPDLEGGKALAEEHSEEVAGPAEKEQQTSETKSAVTKEKPAIAIDQQEEPLTRAE